MVVGFYMLTGYLEIYSRNVRRNTINTSICVDGQKLIRAYVSLFYCNAVFK